MDMVEDALQQGINLHLAGNLATAAKCYSAVLQADPTCADAWHMAGVLAHQSGRSSDGLNYLERAIELNSRDPEYYCNLSTIWRALSQPQAALSAADNAVRIGPDFAAAWFQKGTALLDVDRTDEAVDSFRRALDLGHPAAIVWRSMGHAFQYSGDTANSIECLEKSLQAEPLQSSVYFRLANLVASGNYTFNDDQRRTMHELVSSEKTPPKSLGYVHFALARDLESRGEYTSAFSHHRQANEFYCKFLTDEKRVQPEQHSFQETIDRQIHLFDENRFQQQRDANQASPVPIFVVGMPRSGTTLLTQMLAKHPDIASAGERTEIPSLVFRRQQDKDKGAVLELLDSAWCDDAAESYLRVLRSFSSETKFVIDKLPENFKYLGYIACLFPDAKIIHCRRDPRDVCVSAYCQLFESSQLQMDSADLGLLGRNYRHYLRIMRHWRKVLPIKMHEVSYEELVEDAGGELRRLHDYLDLPWSEECLHFHEQKASVRTASALQVRNPLNRKSIGRWKRYHGQLNDLIEALGDAISQR